MERFPSVQGSCLRRSTIDFIRWRFLLPGTSEPLVSTSVARCGPYRAQAF
jgi:hypothetical protein